MKCNSPQINQTDVVSSSEYGAIYVDIYFIMDGVQSLRDFAETMPHLSRFKYVEDPVFHKFSGYQNRRYFYHDENYLDILVSLIFHICRFNVLESPG